MKSFELKVSPARIVFGPGTLAGFKVWTDEVVE